MTDCDNNNEGQNTILDKGSIGQSVSDNVSTEIKGILKKDECQTASTTTEKISDRDCTKNTSASKDCEQKQVFKNRKMLKKTDSGLSENKPQDIIPPLIKVETIFSQWYTIDTLRVIKGDNFVRQVLRENECTVSSVVATVGNSEDESMLKNTAFREKYIQLCRKLDLQDLEVSQK